MNDSKSSKFGWGMILGTITGALAGLFLAPKTGKKLRADVLKKAREIRKKLEDPETDKAIGEMFDEVSDRSKLWYNQAKDGLSEKLAELSESIENIDKEKYLAAVRKVVDSFRNTKELTEEKLERIKKHLESDFSKLDTRGEKIVSARKYKTNSS